MSLIKKVKAIHKAGGLLLVGDFHLPLLEGDVVDLIEWSGRRLGLKPEEVIDKISASADIRFHLQKERLKFVSDKTVVKHTGLDFFLNKKVKDPNASVKSLDLDFVPARGHVINEKVERTLNPAEKGRWAPEPGKAPKKFYPENEAVKDIKYLKDNQSVSSRDIPVLSAEALNKKSRPQIESIVRQHGGIPQSCKNVASKGGITKTVKTNKADLVGQVIKLQEAKK